MDPSTLLSLAGALKGGGGSKSQSSSSNSLALNSSVNVGVNPLFGIATGGQLDNLTAGSTGLNSGGGASASSSSSPTAGEGGTGFPYGGGYPAVNDIDQQPVQAGLLDGVADLFSNPLMLAGLALGGFLLFQESGKG